ncbi:MAG: NAD(P)H-dependent oxidoreductase [Vicinamibacterales bacterium]
MPRLMVLIASVRQQRVGEAVARWFEGQAIAHGGFDVSLVDLRAVGLSLLEEPNHPRKRQYTQDATKAWSAMVDAADAFVFVMPEYNYTMPPALLNALDHLYHEWHYKPVGLVSYGGVSGGLRSAQSAKPVITTLRMMPLPEGVTIPFVATMIQDGEFHSNEKIDASVKTMLGELAKWTAALSTMRGKP